MNISDLVELNVHEVASSSRIPELSTEAPSSVSVIEYAELKRFGYRVVNDVFADLRGTYVPFRGSIFGPVGIRGRSGPGDWGGRILFQINGHRLNSVILGASSLLSSILIEDVERIEVSRGPGSITYGSNAFYAVINIITKTGKKVERDGATGNVSLSGGGNRRRVLHGELTYQNPPSDSTNIAARVAYTVSDHGGDRRTWFDNSFRSVIDGTSSVSGYDSFNTQLGLSTISIGPVVLDIGVSRAQSEKGGAAYGTLPGYAETLVDFRHWFSATYAVDHGILDSVMLRVAYDYYSNTGEYWYDYGSPETGFLPARNRDVFSGEVVTTEGLFRHTIGDVTLVGGGEWRSNLNLHLRNEDIEFSTEHFDKKRSENVRGVFGQLIYHPLPWMRFNIGGRYDRDDAFGSRITPRLALIFPIQKTTSIKIIYGKAYRSPTPLERYYHDGYVAFKPSKNIKQENVTTKEIVVEHVFANRYYMNVSLYDSRFDNVIEYKLDPADNLLSYGNAGIGGTRGLEFEAKAQWRSGHLIAATYNHARAYDGISYARTLFSPRIWGGLRGTTPIPALGADLSLQYRVIGSVLDRTGEPMTSRQRVDLTLFSDSWFPGIECTFSMLNLLSANGSDPLAGDFRQNRWPVTGRTIHGRLVWRF